MKRIKTTFFAGDAYSKDDFKFANSGVLEIESYEENVIPKDKNLVQEYSFESLWEATLQFGQGIWTATKGFSKMMMFAVIVIIEGLKWLWHGAFDKKEKAVQNDKKVKR